MFNAFPSSRLAPSAHSAAQGGPTNGNEGTQSNNFPLRGGKNTIWEGGTRIVGAIAGPGIPSTGAVTYGKIHVTDWLPTLVSMASGKDWRTFIPAEEPQYELGDGMDVWPLLSGAGPSPRQWLLYECHPNGSSLVHGNAFAFGSMKIIKNPGNPHDENGNFPPPGQDPASVDYLLQCGGKLPPRAGPAADPNQCSDEYCLFNITADPCEYHNLAAEHPDIVADLVSKLAKYQATAVPPLEPEGCQPVRMPLPGGGHAWQPCDKPHAGAFM